MEFSTCKIEIDSLRKIFEHTPVPTYIWQAKDEQYKFIACNKKAVAFSGQGIENLFGKPSEEIFPESPQLIAWMEQCFSSKDSFTHEFSYRMLLTREERLLKGNWSFLEPDIVVLHITDLTYLKDSEEQLQRSARKLEILNAVSKCISMSTTVSEMAWKTVDELQRQLEVDLAVFFVRKQDKLFLKAERSTGLNFPSAGKLQHTVGECLCGLSVQQGISHYSEDIHNDSRCTNRECKMVGVRSFATIPLRITGDTLGVVGIGLKKHRDFSKYAELLESLGAVIATGLHGAMLFDKASQHADTLEERVRERTGELETANQLLRKEIVDRMQAERERSQSQEAFITFVNHFPGMVYIKNTQGKLMFVNQQMMEDLGAEAWLGKTPDQYLPPEQAARFIEHDQLALSGQFITREELVPDIHGTQRIWRMAKFPIKREKSPWLIGCVAVEVTELVRSRQELESSEEKFRTLFEESRDAIMIADFQSGDILDANNQAEILFAANRTQIIGRHYLEFFSPEAWDGCRERFQNLEPLVGSCPKELDVLRKDGRRVPVELSSKRIRLREQDVVQGLFRDLSLHRQSENALRESEERFRELAENIDDVFWVISPDLSRLLYLGIQYEKVWGRSRTEIINDVNKMSDYIVEEDKEVLSSITPETVQQGFQIEYRIRRPDGSIRHLRHSGFPVKHIDGSVLRIVGISQDITLYKTQELILKREKETEHVLTGVAEKLLTSKNVEDASKLLFETALELTKSAKGFIGRFDAQEAFCVLYTFEDNQWARSVIKEKSTDWREQGGEWREVLGKSADFCNHLENADLFSEAPSAESAPLCPLLSVPIKIGERFVGQICLASPDRAYDERDLRLTKRLAALFALTLQRNEYETDIIHSKLDAERANRAKSDFLAKMSHEIRTPMNAIIGMINIVLDSQLQVEHREYLTIAALAAENLMEVIDNILDLSKIEAGMMALEMMHFDLSALLAETTTLAKYQFHESKLSLSLDLAPDVPVFLKGDRNRLRQVLINILSNAVKFTEKGEIVLRVRSSNAATDESSVVLQFSITDTGPGIPLEGQDKVFNKFEQLDDSTTRKYGGSGLGLAICKQLVELMEGTIWFESIPEKGSTFHFTIRCEPGDALFVQEQQQPVFPEKNNVGESLQVLVVDDNESNRKVAAALLRRLGHHSVLAGSAQEAFQLLRETRFDAVLMDVEMPEVDGLEAARSIRSGIAGKEQAEIPIIALTAHALAGFRERCLAAGMNDFFSKPVDIQQLAAKLGGMEKLETISAPYGSDQQQELAVLDRDAALRRFDGDNTLYKEIGKAFVDELAGRLQGITTNLEQDDHLSLALSLHSLKSHCGTIGATYAQDYAAQLESKARTGDLKGVAAGLDGFRQSLDEVVKALQKA